MSVSGILIQQQIGFDSVLKKKRLNVGPTVSSDFVEIASRKDLYRSPKRLFAVYQQFWCYHSNWKWPAIIHLVI